MKKKKPSKQTILTVEDDATLLKVMANALADEGFEVIKAEDGQDGLEKALKHHPDMILLDIMMPVMDGMTMLKKLRKDDWGKSVYVMILTNADPSPDLISEASRAPYVSSYYMKSQYGVREIIEMAKEKLKKPTIKNQIKK